MKTFSSISLLIATALLVALVSPATILAQTTTRYVSTTGTNTDPTSATSWATSTTNLQGAIDALGVTEVWVAAGVYKPTTTTGPNSRTISFSMKNGVAIYGGFVGSETALSGRPAINLTTPSGSTLSGDIGTPNSTTDNSIHIISNPFNLSLTNTAILDGFVLTGGRADRGLISQDGGGAIYNESRGSGQFCRPTIRNCFFQNNSASGFGGAIFNEYSSPHLINCFFQNNSAGDEGGAIFNNYSNPHITNCAFQSNSALGGGAMSNDGSSPHITNCSFQSNSSSNYEGGAMFNFNGTPHLTNCVLFGNGGNNTFYNEFISTVSISYSLFDDSVTDYSSGPGNLTVTASPFASPGSVALSPCSPAINAGTNSATGLVGISTDLAGNLRIVDGRVDMGALEYQTPISGASLLSLQANESTCPVRLVGRATGTSFVFTNTQGYVFSNVYHVGGTYDVSGLGVKQPGVYTLTATYTNECGSSVPVRQTVTVSRSCP